MVGGVRHGGPVKDGAGGRRGSDKPELFREQEGVAGAEVGLAEERVEHGLGLAGVLEAVEGETAQAIEGGGESVVVLVFLANRGGGEVEGGLIFLGR